MRYFNSNSCGVTTIEGLCRHDIFNTMSKQASCPHLLTCWIRSLECTEIPTPKYPTAGARIGVLFGFSFVVQSLTVFYSPQPITVRTTCRQAGSLIVAGVLHPSTGFWNWMQFCDRVNNWQSWRPTNANSPTGHESKKSKLTVTEMLMTSFWLTRASYRFQS